jgi:hypothetical protein
MWDSALTSEHRILAGDSHERSSTVTLRRIEEDLGERAASSDHATTFIERKGEHRETLHGPNLPNHRGMAQENGATSMFENSASARVKLAAHTPRRTQATPT